VKGGNMEVDQRRIGCPVCNVPSIVVELTQEHANKEHDECFVDFSFNQTCECNLTEKQLDDLMEGVEIGFIYENHYI
jgi:hypothetical protein